MKLAEDVRVALAAADEEMAERSPDEREALKQVAVTVNVGEVPSNPIDFQQNADSRGQYERFFETAVSRVDVPSGSEDKVAAEARVLQKFLEQTEVLLLNRGAQEYDGDPSVRSTSVGDVGGQDMSCLNPIGGVQMASDSFGYANDQMREALSLVGRNSANQSAQAALEQAKSVAMAMTVPESVAGDEGPQWLANVNMQLIENATEQIRALIGTITEDGDGYKLSGGALVYGDPNKGYVQQVQDEVRCSYDRLRRCALNYKEMEMAVHHAKQNLILDHVMAAEMWVARSMIKKQLDENPEDRLLHPSNFIRVATETKKWSILSDGTTAEALQFFEAMHQNYNEVKARHEELQALVNNKPDFVLKDLPPLIVPEFVRPFEERHEDWLIRGMNGGLPRIRQWKPEALVWATDALDALVKRVAEKNANIEYLKTLTQQLRKLWSDALTDYDALKKRADEDIRNNALARWGSMEQFRRGVLEQWVRRSAYIREADTVESELAARPDPTNSYSLNNVGWVGTSWIGRRMRDTRTHRQNVPEVAGNPGRGRFENDGRPLRTPRLTCAYESLLWYFGGDDALELMTNVDQYRITAIRTIGCRLADDDAVVKQFKQGIEGVDPNAKLNPADFDNFGPELQQLVESAGMRYYCARLDTLALCTIDKLETRQSLDGASLVTYDVHQAQAIRETDDADPNANRSEEWKTATSILDLMARIYCARACIAGGHDQLFIAPDGSELYTVGNPVKEHEPPLTNLPFGMPGVAFELKLTKQQAFTSSETTERAGIIPTVTGQSPKIDETDSRFMEPFRWEDTILLSKMFSLVEQMALDLKPDKGSRKWDGTKLRASKIQTYHKIFTDTETQEARHGRYNAQKSWMKVGSWSSKQANMHTPYSWQMATKPTGKYFSSGNYNPEDVSESDSDYFTLNRRRADKRPIAYASEQTSVEDVDARGWSLAMEIEANPHAAALWAVYLHRLLTLRVLIPPKDQEEAVDPYTQKRVKLGLDAYFTYGLMSQLFQTDTVQKEGDEDPNAKRFKKRAVDPKIPNTCDAWIYSHPSVQMFLLSPLGQYMQNVFETAKHSWGVRESRVLELALVWGGRKLNSDPKKLEASLLSTMGRRKPVAGSVQDNLAHLEVCRTHSALRKVVLDRSTHTTAADMYLQHYRYKPELKLTKVVNFCRRSVFWVNPHTIAFLAQALEALNFVVPGYGLVRHGLQAYNSLNPTARQILHTAFGSMLFRHVAPEMSKATIVMGSNALVRAGILTGNLLENAMQTATSVAAVVPLALSEALKHNEVLAPTDIFLTTLDDIAAGMLDGKGVFEMFSAWKKTVVNQINAKFNEDGIANFNHKSVMSLQGFMWGMVNFGWVDTTKEPKKLALVGVEQWKMRFSSVQYLMHIDNMQARPDEHGPVIWEVFEDDGRTGKFSWIDEPTFRCALMTSRPNIARVIGAVRAFSGGAGLAVGLAEDGLKNGIDAALNLQDAVVKKYSESDPLTFDLVRTSVQKRAGEAFSTTFDAADAAFQQTSAYLRMVYECSDVGADVKESVKGSIMPGWAMKSWNWFNGNGQHPREREECKRFFNDREAWWKEVKKNPTRRQQMKEPMETTTETSETSETSVAKEGKKRERPGDDTTKQSNVDTTVVRGVTNPAPGIPLAYPDLISNRTPMDTSPDSANNTQALPQNFEILQAQGTATNMLYLSMKAIVGLGGTTWILAHGSPRLRQMFNVFSYCKQTGSSGAPVAEGVMDIAQENTVDDLMRVAGQTAQAAMRANPGVGDLARKLEIRKKVNLLMRFHRFRGSAVGSSGMGQHPP